MVLLNFIIIGYQTRRELKVEDLKIKKKNTESIERKIGKKKKSQHAN